MNGEGWGEVAGERYGAMIYVPNGLYQIARPGSPGADAEDDAGNAKGA